MKTIYLKKSTACLFFLIYLAVTSLCFAANEVTSYTPDVPADGVARQQVTDFNVTWDEPDMGGDLLIGYAYLWNESETALTHTTYTPENYTGFNNSGVEIVSLTANEVAADDSDMLRYLHIQTVYNGSTLSSDVVIGPFNFDNVCTGTFRLPDPDTPTNDLASTRETTVDIEVGAPVDISSTGLYLNELDTIPATGTDASTTTSYTLQNTTPGSKTIYAWFEDEVGNISSAFPATFTLLDPVSIDPYTADIDPVVTDLKTFSMAGTAGLYDWEIFIEKPVNSGDTVAQFNSNQSSSITNLNEVVVQGLNEGTFKLRATNDSGSTWIESGTITVLESSIQFTIDLGEGFNLVSFPLIKNSDSIQDVIANQLPGHFIPSSAARLYDYDPSTSSFDQYYYYSSGPTTEWRKVGEATATDFQISADKGYWVNIPTGSGNQQVIFEGIVPSSARTINLVTGFNLVGSSYPTDYLITNSNLTGGTGSFIPSSADRIYLYDPSTLQFTQYYYYSADSTTEWRKVGEGSATADSFIAGQGFWMNFKAPLAWNFQ